MYCNFSLPQWQPQAISPSKNKKAAATINGGRSLYAVNLAPAQRERVILFSFAMRRMLSMA